MNTKYNDYQFYFEQLENELKENGDPSFGIRGHAISNMKFEEFCIASAVGLFNANPYNYRGGYSEALSQLLEKYNISKDQIAELVSLADDIILIFQRYLK